jgi:hypothetical protein
MIMNTSEPFEIFLHDDLAKAGEHDLGNVRMVVGNGTRQMFAKASFYRGDDTVPFMSFEWLDV